jgi:hypothetical protein
MVVPFFSPELKDMKEVVRMHSIDTNVRNEICLFIIIDLDVFKWWLPILGYGSHLGEYGYN